MLGIRPVDLDRLRRIPFEEAVKGLQAIQEGARKSFRKLALSLHPDHTGGNEEKTKQFVEIKAFYEQFMKLQMHRPVLTPTPFPSFNITFSNYRNTASTVSTGGFSPRFVVVMKPRGV